MFDVATEQIIKIKAPKISYAYKGIVLIALVLALTTIPSTGIIGFGLAAVFCVCAVLLFKYYDGEYEYSMVESDLSIDRISSKNSRRRCGVYHIGKAQLIADPKSQDAMRLERKELRNHDYTSNDGNESTIVVYCLDEKNELVRLFLQPNEEMLEAMKKASPRDAFKIDLDVKKNIDTNI